MERARLERGSGGLALPYLWPIQRERASCDSNFTPRNFLVEKKLSGAEVERRQPLPHPRTGTLTKTGAHGKFRPRRRCSVLPPSSCRGTSRKRAPEDWRARRRSAAPRAVWVRVHSQDGAAGVELPRPCQDPCDAYPPGCAVMRPSADAGARRASGDLARRAPRNELRRGAERGGRRTCAGGHHPLPPDRARAVQAQPVCLPVGRAVPRGAARPILTRRRARADSPLHTAPRRRLRRGRLHGTAAGALTPRLVQGTGITGSYAQHLLKETETIHARARRYTSPDEKPFTPVPELPTSALPPLIVPENMKFLQVSPAPCQPAPAPAR